MKKLVDKNSIARLLLLLPVSILYTATVRLVVIFWSG